MDVIVGAAVVRAGLLLAQEREWPEKAAGKWELPGGRVEPGESEVDALRRECAEELDVDVVIGARVGRDIRFSRRKVLRIFAAELENPEKEPRAVEHRAVRWISAAELDDVDWLPADRKLLPDLHALLTPRR